MDVATAQTFASVFGGELTPFIICIEALGTGARWPYVLWSSGWERIELHSSHHQQYPLQ